MTKNPLKYKVTKFQGDSDNNESGRSKKTRAGPACSWLKAKIVNGRILVFISSIISLNKLVKYTLQIDPENDLFR